MVTTESTLRILVVDDSPQVRETVKEFLASGGYRANDVGTAWELLHQLAEQRYDLVLLDNVLAKDASIEQTLELVRELFPDVSVPHEEVLNDLGLGSWAPVSGLYLLPVVKAISPRTSVIMLTGAWDGESDESYLRKWGSEVTILKCGGDRDFRPGASLHGLGAELCRFVDEVATQGGKSR